MSNQSEAKEFLLKKKEYATIDADYNAISAHPEHLCDPSDIEAEKILKYIRCVHKSDYDALKYEYQELQEKYRPVGKDTNFPFSELRNSVTVRYGLLVYANDVTHEAHFITAEDVHELLQSKDQRIKELEKSLQASRDNADICTKVLIDGSKEKDAEIQRLREALEYYAPSEKWSSCISDGNIFNEQTGDFVECFDSENMDCGSTAREALSGGKE